jgi:hypothetical protein
MKTRPSLSLIQTPNTVSLYPRYPEPLCAIEEWWPGFSVLEGLVERENDYALIISLDSVNSLVFVEAYTPIPSSARLLFHALIHLPVISQIPSRRLLVTPPIPLPT